LLKDRSAVAVLTDNVKKINIAVSTLGKQDLMNCMQVTNSKWISSRVFMAGFCLISVSNATFNCSNLY